MSEKPIEADEGAINIESRAAARMKAAREAAGLTLADVAATTRVPLRHLAALEEGDFGALPGTTYCAGFARAYARAVGLDEVALVAELRGEIGEMGGLGQNAHEFEEAVNPARIPPRWLAWTAALIALLLATGYAIWRTQVMTPQTDEQIAEQVPIEGQGLPQGVLPAPAPQAAPTGPVVMTAADTVWIRIYEADGTRLYEGTLERGQSYTLPEDARDPMILTGRPDALAVTVGGQAISPLGPAERTISDVRVSAAALLERARAPAPADENGPAPDNAGAAAPAATVAPAGRPAPSPLPGQAGAPQAAVSDGAATAP